MEGITKTRVGLLLLWLAVSAVTAAQTFVTPSANTNIIGVTPDPANIRDLGLKQQQEPSCIIRPSNEAFIFCAYNDLRAADLPSVQGDSWMGVSMSNDSGQTWFSRLAPGFLDHPNSLGMGFAADPGVVAIAGNSPGLAILNYIAAFRDSDAGVLAIQRWVEFPQEDQDFWKAEDEIFIVADGSEGRFIDKPAFYYLVDDPGQQGVINEDIQIENGGGTVSIQTPTGTLIVVYAVFTGNGGNTKLLMRKSYDNGKNWTNAEKISEEQNEVTGVSVTAVGQDFVIVYRRRGDTNEPDAILSASCSNDGNQKCTKGEEIFQICPFDQPASGSTFRTFSFPWAANDGNRFWAFAADRVFPDSSCAPVAGAAGLYAGKPRIVAMSSLDGKIWVGGSADKTKPVVIAARDDGFQLMPVAFGTKGRVDLAWYDTFREEDIGLPAGANDLLINDYVSTNGLARVFRKADVYMTRLNANSCGNGANTGCDPFVESPVRVSQYHFAVDLADPTVGAEIEGHLPNLTLYASGTLAFNGDYISLATPALRKDQNGKWISNSLPVGSNDLPETTARQDLFVAWGDNRDVRADIPALDNGTQIPNLGGGTQMPYTPPLNSDANPGGPMSELDPDESNDDSGYARPGELVAEDEPDDNPTLPSDIAVCAAGFDFSRSRDSNVYSSLVRDEPSLIAPTPTKPLGTIQRMFPLVLNNIDTINAKEFCLQISTQPEDYPGPLPAEGNGLASFYQLPAFAPFLRGQEKDRLDVVAPAGSSASRAVFVTTNNANSVVTVNAYEGACPLDPNDPINLPLVNSVQLSDGDLFDPAFCQANPADPVCIDGVANQEIHNIDFAAPVLQTPVLQAPTFQTPTFQTPVLQTPVFQTPTFQTPTFQTPTFQTPVFQTPTFQTPVFQTPTFQTPVLQTPTFQTPTFQTGSLIGDTAETAPQQLVYQDITYPVNAAANVTTTYSADIALGGLNPDESAVQLIAWTPNTYATSADCYAQPIADQQVIAYTDLDAQSLQSVTLPTTFSSTNQDPYAGELSFFGQPDKDIAVTVRIWAIATAADTLFALEAERLACEAAEGPDCADLGARSLITFGASAHSCKTGDAVVNTQNPSGVDCLNNGNEKILEDKQGPTISFQIDSSPEATGPDGAIVNYTATATDNVDPAPSLSCVPASGETFGLGANTVSCFAGDASLNTTVEAFTVTIVDTTAPTLSPVANLPTAEATSAAGAVVNFTPPVASDIVDPDPTVSCVPASGSTFALGTTEVSCTASDGTNTSPPVTFDVTVADTTSPEAFTLDDISAEATSAGGASVSFGPFSTNDVVDGSITAACTPVSGSNFVIGTSPVSCSATDAAGNPPTVASFNVTVADSTAPSLSLPASITVEARDANDVAVTYPVDPSTGSVTVEANLPPPDGARITFVVPVTDTVDTSPTVTCSTESNSVLPVGLTSISCTATDADGNVSTTLEFSVTIEDTTPPVFSVVDGTVFPFDADQPGGAFVDLAGSGTVVATDRGAEILPVCVATPQGGGSMITLPAILAPGDYDVACSVDGVALTTVTVNVIVDINDQEPPVLNIPSTELQVQADPVTGTAIVDFLAPAGFGGETITATDIVDPDVTIICSPLSGTEFAVLPIGQGHTVSCTASDDGPNSSGAPNTTTAVFTLVVNDVTPPTAPTLPVGPEGPGGPNIIQEASGADGAIVTYSIGTTDNADPDPSVVCAPTSGAVFPLGNTEVSCLATDFFGNVSSGGFVVAVRDTIAPVVTAPADVVYEAEGVLTTVPIGTATATDAVGPVTITSDAPATFPLGTTVVTWTATDGSLNAATATQNVTVQDTTAPVVSVADIDVPVLTATVDLTINYVADVTAVDLVGGDVSASLFCRIDSGPPGYEDDGTEIRALEYGTWIAICSAVDSAGNSGSTTFSITVSFPYNIKLILSNKPAKPGSVIPVDWQYLDAGTVIASGFIAPTVRWFGPFQTTDTSCSDVADMIELGDDAGSSDKRYTASSNTWQFSWKTPNLKNKNVLLVISPPGQVDSNATRCVKLK